MLAIINGIVIDLKVPLNINNFWCVGSTLGVIVSVQIITGLLISMHYASTTNGSFTSIVNLHYNINRGWVLHNIHVNGASFIFILLYLHIIRNLYYGTFYQVTTWLTGSSILFVIIGVSFIGYVLPWGQISFWGATVITRLLSSVPYVGRMVVYWVWGGYSVDEPTLSRLFRLHFILPLFILMLIIVHLLNLHMKGSRNPLGLSLSDTRKIKFFPFFTYKDGIIFRHIFVIVGGVIFFFPYVFSEADNFFPANSIVTPAHIQPEWYFLFAYAILRSVPNKLGGVILMFLAISILFIFPFGRKTWQSTVFSIKKKPFLFYPCFLAYGSFLSGV